MTRSLPSPLTMIIKADVKANTDAIAVLNGEAGEEGSVAYKITKMVLEADENNATDKIAEIAWIANHPPMLLNTIRELPPMLPILRL